MRCQRFLLEEFLEGFAPFRTSQLAQGLGFDLTNPFTGHTKVLTNFFEGTRTSIEKTKAQFEDTPFAGGSNAPEGLFPAVPEAMYRKRLLLVRELLDPQ